MQDGPVNDAHPLENHRIDEGDRMSSPTPHRLVFALLLAALLLVTLGPLLAGPEPPSTEELRLRREEIRLMERQTRALESIAKELERMRREG